MGLDGLYSVIQRHTKEEFEDLALQYDLHRKISVWDGEITTYLPLDRIGQALGLDLNILPKSNVFACRRLEQIKTDIGSKEYNDEIDKDIRTLAITYRGKIKYSKIKEKRYHECV